MDFPRSGVNPIHDGLFDIENSIGEDDREEPRKAQVMSVLDRVFADFQLVNVAEDFRRSFVLFTVAGDFSQEIPAAVCFY